jgi:sulfur carrier protein
MQILVNGQMKDVPEAQDIRALVLSLGLNPEGVAVALNAEVVPRSRQAQTLLTEGDKIEVIRAVGGG